MPSMSIREVLDKVAGRKTETGLRSPPTFAKSDAGFAARLEDAIEDLSPSLAIEAKGMLAKAMAVRDGGMSPYFFEQQLRAAHPAVRSLFIE